MNACPECERPVTLTDDGGRLACEGCAAQLWFARLVDSHHVVTQQQIETAYGFKTDDFDEQAVLELVRELGDRDHEPSHAWAADDFPPASELMEQAPRVAANPYQPPASLPRRSDPRSESFVFYAAVPCDTQSLQWSTRSYARQTDVIGLITFGLVVVVGILLFWFDETVRPLSIGTVPSWVVIMSLLAVVYYLASKVGTLPYIRMLDRRSNAEPLCTDDYYWIYLRRWTLTGISHQHVVTWPLNAVRCIHNESHLVVFRTERRRVLYVPSTAATTPESFKEFRKGIKKRMHLFWREQFLRIDYIS